MKKRLFIGSSKEGLNNAKLIKSEIEKQCGDWIDVSIWDEGDIFELNSSTLDCLIKSTMLYDYAILVASNDDTIYCRETQKSAARDNIIFEAGLFLGAIGKNRTFIVADRNIGLPSDLNGITVIFYDQNISCDKIVKKINDTKHSHQLKLLPSAALALGYFENYIMNFCKKMKASKLKVIIPLHFNNICDEISSYKTKYGSNNCILANKHLRPIGYRYARIKKTYWDIPTTLQTIHKLVSNITTNTEIGNNPECDNLLKKEMYNFGSTLEVLIEKNKICENKVEIKFI